MLDGTFREESSYTENLDQAVEELNPGFIGLMMSVVRDCLACVAKCCLCFARLVVRLFESREPGLRIPLGCIAVKAQLGDDTLAADTCCLEHEGPFAVPQHGWGRFEEAFF